VVARVGDADLAPPSTRTWTLQIRWLVRHAMVDQVPVCDRTARSQVEAALGPRSTAAAGDAKPIEAIPSAATEAARSAPIRRALFIPFPPLPERFALPEVPITCSVTDDRRLCDVMSGLSDQGRFETVLYFHVQNV
jgi:hypothetical protein